MSKRVGLKGFTDALDKILAQYGDEVNEKSTQLVPKAAQRAAKALREESRQKFGSPDEEYRYAKGWTYETKKGRLRTEATVYNKNSPGLAHLLEHGHANRYGGRTPGRSHIAPVEEAVVEAFRKEVEDSL